ncbi:MAG: HNH endonuclease [Verrucomicrobiaceae bacterium]|nr:HNH endonuclease [Verrucomicrobiaceae bacterium]
MSESRIAAELRRKVAARAGRRCEYCLIHEDDCFWGCEIDHIFSEKHGGTTSLANLAFCCAFCNRHKGADISTLDARKRLIPLFHPRRDRWQEHFRFRGVEIIGVTALGRATAKLLRFNDPARLEEREAMTSPRE